MEKTTAEAGAASVHSNVKGANEQPTVLSTPTAAASDAKGGVYVLRDGQTQEVMRSGRTNDLVRREGEHARDPVLKDYLFEWIYKTDAYDAQRGLEKYLHEIYNPPLNKIRPVGPNNPKIEIYEQAAKDHLQNLQK
jgi:hypothetical protein